MYCLREHLSSQNSAARKAELCKEIARLNNVNRVQQRIITDLSFRRVLEMLLASVKPSITVTRWKDFFESTLKKAQAQHSDGPTDYPLIPVLNKYSRPEVIADVGTKFYSTLSTTLFGAFCSTGGSM